MEHKKQASTRARHGAGLPKRQGSARARHSLAERGRAALRPRHAHDTRTCARAALLPRHARSYGHHRSAGTPAGTPTSSLPTTPRRACSTLSTAGHALSNARAHARAEDPLGHLPPVRRRRPSARSARRTAPARARRRADALVRPPPVHRRRLGAPRAARRTREGADRKVSGSRGTQ
jgi:hypothetical protein